jgi:hypothetical protein
MRMRIAICFLVGTMTPAYLLAQRSNCNDPHASMQANAMAVEHRMTPGNALRELDYR